MALAAAEEQSSAALRAVKAVKEEAVAFAEVAEQKAAAELAVAREEKAAAERVASSLEAELVEREREVNSSTVPNLSLPNVLKSTHQRAHLYSHQMEQLEDDMEAKAGEKMEALQVELSRALDERASWLDELRTARAAQQTEKKHADELRAQREAEAVELAKLRKEVEELRTQMAALVRTCALLLPRPSSTTPVWHPPLHRWDIRTTSRRSSTQ